jgi:hypothetical protein
VLDVSCGVAAGGSDACCAGVEDISISITWRWDLEKRRSDHQTLGSSKYILAIFWDCVSLLPKDETIYISYKENFH